MEKAWVKLMGFTSAALNRNFFIATLLIFLSYAAFATIQFFKVTEELSKERIERRIEVKQIAADCDTTVTRLINTYQSKVEGLYEKRLNDLKK